MVNAKATTKSQGAGKCTRSLEFAKQSEEYLDRKRVYSVKIKWSFEACYIRRRDRECRLR